MKRLKSSGASVQDLKQFYTSIIRPICEYAVPMWATSIPKHLIQKLEIIQKRATKIMLPNLTYTEALAELKLSTLQDRRMMICKKFFSKIQSRDDKINDILPQNKETKYNLRKMGRFEKPKCRTSRYKNSFVPYAIDHFN